MVWPAAPFGDMWVHSLPSPDGKNRCRCCSVFQLLLFQLLLHDSFFFGYHRFVRLTDIDEECYRWLFLIPHHYAFDESVFCDG